MATPVITDFDHRRGTKHNASACPSLYNPDTLANIQTYPQSKCRVGDLVYCTTTEQWMHCTAAGTSTTLPASFASLPSVGSGVAPAINFIDDFNRAAGFTAFWTAVTTGGGAATIASAANGILRLNLDSTSGAAHSGVAQAAVMAYDVASSPRITFVVKIVEKGDDAAVDIDFGWGSAAPTTNVDALDTYVSFHVDGDSANLLVKVKDSGGATTSADTGVDIVEGTALVLEIDMTSKTNIKFLVGGTRVLTGSTFSVATFAAQLSPIMHVEKSSTAAVPDVHVDYVGITALRVA